MSINKTLLSAIQNRGQKRTEFGHGIHTADVFVRTMAERIGLEPCYRCASTRQTSFDDILQKAAQTLVYSNSEMEIEEKAKRLPGLPKGIELPKNTLMVFKHTLTSSNKDRDGDILRSEGMELDPNMLLLWQHVSTMPIGKFLAVNQQNSKRVKVYSCIVDMNETSHDAAVMVDNDMGRFSHGFRALEYEEMKDGNDVVGFDVKRAEIMEESLVSVPANIDADTEDVLLSLVEGGKLTSPLMKEYGKILKEHRPVMVPGTSITFREGGGSRELQCGSFADLKAAADAGLIVGGKASKNEDGFGEGPEGKAGTSKEKDGNEQGEEEKPGESEVKGVYIEGLEGSWEWIQDKLSQKTKPYLSSHKIKVSDDDWVHMTATYPDRAIVCVESRMKGTTEYYQIDWSMKDNTPEYLGQPKSVRVNVTTSSKTTEPEMTVKGAMVFVLTNATRPERDKMQEAIEIINTTEERGKSTKRYRSIVDRMAKQ